MEYGCIAEHLGHSFSKIIHEKIDRYDYTLQEVSKRDLDAFMTKRDFKGINVTIPYKQDVIPYLSAISDTAKMIGAVNTIRNMDGKLYGYNTDFSGMRALLHKMGLTLQGKKVLILGTGGTAKTAKAVAESLHAREIRTVSRAEKENSITYREVYASHTDAQIILNTTPSGMYPHIEDTPLDLSAFSELEGVMDAIYNPLRSKLVLSAQEKGIRAEGGFYMLISQAIAAAEIFTEKTYAPNLAEEIYHTLTKQKQNLVLIGMPSSGKTTLGRSAAESLGRTFVDLDAEIVRKDGRPIAQIFAEDGEVFFRDLETQIVREFAAQTGLVISTGGGCVLRQDNVRLLKMNGKLIWLDRPIYSLCPTDDRPTADSMEKMQTLYRVRMPIYKASAEAIVHVGDDVRENTMRVVNAFTEEKV